MYLGHVSLWVDGTTVQHCAPALKALSTLTTATAAVLVRVAVHSC